MATVDQPGERGRTQGVRERDPARDPDEHPGVGRLRLYRGGWGRRVRAAESVLPREVAQRLATLERRVEEAFGRWELRDRPGPEVVLTALDGVLATVVGARRAPRGAGAWLRARLRDGSRHLRGLPEAALRGAYRYWWRVEVSGLVRIPPSGPTIVAVNRSGALVPWEALMIAVALADAHPARRAARLLVDDWCLRHPVLGPALARAGAVRSTAANLRRLLAQGEVVVLFPEGRRAVAKPFHLRYRLAPFDRGTFAQVAIETGSPVVPVAVIGAEEVHPVLARLDGPGHLLGLPTLPITPTFPWLGLAGLVPLPTKWWIHAGDPLEVATRHDPGEARRPAAVRALASQVRERLQALVLEGLRRRRSVFRG